MKHNNFDPKELVRRAVARGEMRYPPNQRFNHDGSPDPMLSPTRISVPQRYSTDLFIRAYNLRQTGLSLAQTAAACGVPRGSVVYLISQGHEIHLANLRTKA